MFILSCLILLIIAELFYFRIANRFNIIDKPNHRSSHTAVTIRGGGIIFPLAGILAVFYIQDHYLFVTGLILISVISFADDVKGMPNLLRSLIHFIAVGLLIAEVHPDIPVYWYLCIFILIVGTINAWNFMDGINGITGGYSLVTLGSLFYINEWVYSFVSSELLFAVIISLVIFNFFNFRKKARCFAGDVGSVSIAFIICFLLLRLVVSTENLLFLSFLLLYGLDTITTILFRLIRRENIFQAHRSHFYQFLANEKGWPHLGVAGLYAGVQGLINIGLIYYTLEYSPGSAYEIGPILGICLVGGVLFVWLRWVMEGKERLLGKGERSYHQSR